MGVELGKGSRAFFWSPPLRLRAVPVRLVPIFSLLWFLAFMLSIAAVALGTIHALRETYDVQPAVRALGLDYDVEPNGRISIKAEALPGRTFTLAAINGAPVDPEVRVPELGRRFREARGSTIAVDLREPNGTVQKLRLTRKPIAADRQASRSRDLRVAARLVSGILACTTLLVCSLLLARRRPSDPVALLFAFAFAGLASTIDPPLAMWMAYGWPGNVRELMNVLSHVLAFSDGEEVLPEHLPPRVRGQQREGPLPFNEHLTFKDAKEQLLENFEREYITSVLARCEGNLSRAARESGLHRKSIERLVKKYQLDARSMKTTR